MIPACDHCGSPLVAVHRCGCEPESPPRWVEYRAWTKALDERDGSRLRAERAEHSLAQLRAAIEEVDQEKVLPVVRHVLREELAAAVLVPAPWTSWQKALAILAGVCLWGGGYLAGALGALP